MITTTITVCIQFEVVIIPYDPETGILGLSTLVDYRATGTEASVNRLLKTVSGWKSYHDFHVEFVHVARLQDLKHKDGRSAAIVARRDIIE